MPEAIVKVDEWTGKWLINEAYRPIAEQLCRKFTKEIGHIATEEILFIDNGEAKKMAKGKKIFAQIGTIPAKYSEIVEQMTKKRFYYVMEFFKPHTDQLSKEQIVAVVYHELRHIGSDGKIIDHHITDWIEMIDKLGPAWVSTKGSIPDLLDEAVVNWDSIQGPLCLFPNESKLQVVK